ncbi:MAG TPA: hypothetical protein VK571_00990 [Gemmatimonadaceae bacterium]|nr:hypothetical protein [Gemmatimonadaceae bacterium]
MNAINSTDLYAQLLAADVPIDHHESDLYVKVTDVSRPIVRTYEFYSSNVTVFTSRIDGAQWYDIPFAYWPFWERVARVVGWAS